MIGTGHLRRCITLAQELKQHGAIVVFACRAQGIDLEKELQDVTDDRVVLDWELTPENDVQAVIDQSILVHCLHTSNHAEMNMRSIPYMRNAFSTLVGYSSKDRDDETDIIAATLGAVVLEKRLTMNRNLPGHHHILSKEPKEFEEYVKLMRNIRHALGDYDLRPSEADLEERQKWFRHIVVNQDISKGTVLAADMLEGKRPENGISPEYIDFFIGKETKRDLQYNQALSWDDV